MIDGAREIFETNFYGSDSGQPGICSNPCEEWWWSDHQCLVLRDFVCASDVGSIFRLEICVVELYQCLAH